MLKTGILNPQINNLLSRFRHTNTIVISDRGFPFWKEIETIDITLVDNIPTVLQVIEAIKPMVVIGNAWMAEEFLKVNEELTKKKFLKALEGINVEFEPHLEFKKRVPKAIGLIRTADTIQYANIIIESA
ncbi:MAG TPA: RbsD/FucU domain-containing protein [Verrucomicrobiota bacterium]|nr:RbsD/FucU domain-containing protein [Verrucomicrobiota bacterium]